MLAVREPVFILRMNIDPTGRLSTTEGKAVSCVTVFALPFGSGVALLISLSIKQRYNKSILQVAARFKYDHSFQRFYKVYPGMKMQDHCFNLE